MRWLKPYPRAGALQAGQLQPLPVHLLGEAFEATAGAPEGFTSLPFWTTRYVGAGPFVLDRWEQGAYLEGAAFAAHALGRAKSDRIRVQYITDSNTALANLLSGAIHVTFDEGIRLQQAVVVRREWAASGGRGGTVLLLPGLWRLTQVQLHPDRVNPAALTNLRVRKALAFSVDRQAINEGVYEGEALPSDSIIPPTVDYYAAVDRAVTKYPYDLRRSQQLMAEAGFGRDPDGIYTGPTGGRLSMELKVIGTPQNVSEQSIMAATWRAAGFEVQEAVLPLAQAQDAQVRALFPALFSTNGNSGDEQLPLLGSAAAPRPENRWFGVNRGSWFNAEYDRLVAAFESTLDRSQRIEQAVRMVQIFSDEVPSIAINFTPFITTWVAAVRGPGPIAPDSSVGWNVHEWELI